MSFRVSTGHGYVLFNAKSYIDVMNIDRIPVLHIVDDAKKVLSTPFPSENVDGCYLGSHRYILV